LGQLTVTQLFELLDALREEFAENADEWFLTGGRDSVDVVLRARDEIRTQWDNVETELRRRTWNRWPLPTFHANQVTEVDSEEDSGAAWKL